MSEEKEPSFFWVLFFLALCADIILRVLDRFDSPKIATQEKLFLAGTTGTSGFQVDSGIATIPAGSTQVTVSTSKLLVIPAPDNFVIFSVSGLTIYIDAPQSVDIKFNWMAV